MSDTPQSYVAKNVLTARCVPGDYDGLTVFRIVCERTTGISIWAPSVDQAWSLAVPVVKAALLGGEDGDTLEMRLAFQLWWQSEAISPWWRGPEAIDSEADLIRQSIAYASWRKAWNGGVK